MDINQNTTISNLPVNTQQRDWQWRGWRLRYVFTQNPDLPKDAPAILLLHGFGAAVGHWRHNYQELSRHYRVYALDLLGFGNSQKPPTYYGAEVWVEQVFDFWQTLIRSPMVIAGNSIGALVALLAAHRHPEMAKGVITISLPDLAEIEEMVPRAIRPLKRSLEAIVGGLLAVPLFYLIRRPAVIRFVLRNFAYGNAAMVDRQLVQIIAKPAQDKDAARAFYYLNLSMAQASNLPTTKQAIAELKVPILIIWGLGDRIIPPYLGKKLVQYSPSAELLELANVGHCPQDEVPELVNAHIHEWIGRL